MKIVCPKCDGVGIIGGGRLDWEPCPRCEGEGEIEASNDVRFEDRGDWPWLRDVAGD